MKVAMALDTVPLISLSAKISFFERCPKGNIYVLYLRLPCLGLQGSDSPKQAFGEEKDKWLAQDKGLERNTYSHKILSAGRPDTGVLMGGVGASKNPKDGKLRIMFQYLSSKEEEREKTLEFFKKCVGYGRLKKWPIITKEELNRINFRY